MRLSCMSKTQQENPIPNPSSTSDHQTAPHYANIAPTMGLAGPQNQNIDFMASVSDVDIASNLLTVTRAPIKMETSDLRHQTQVVMFSSPTRLSSEHAYRDHDRHR